MALFKLSLLLSIVLVSVMKFNIANAYIYCNSIPCSGYCCGFNLEQCCTFPDDNDYLTIVLAITGGSFALTILCIAVIAYLIVRHRRKRMYANARMYQATHPQQQPSYYTPAALNNNNYNNNGLSFASPVYTVSNVAVPPPVYTIAVVDSCHQSESSCEH